MMIERRTWLGFFTVRSISSRRPRRKKGESWYTVYRVFRGAILEENMQSLVILVLSLVRFCYDASVIGVSFHLV